VPTHQIDEAYIREWLVLGAFHPDDLDVDYLVDSGGELGVNPEEGDSVNNGNSGSLTWQRYNSQRDEIKIIDALGPNERATAYAFCIIESERAGFGVMLLGSDDGACVYFNGKPYGCFYRIAPLLKGAF
jgi:hypothetical protein